MKQCTHSKQFNQTQRGCSACAKESRAGSPEAVFAAICGLSVQKQGASGDDRSQRRKTTRVGAVKTTTPRPPPQRSLCIERLEAVESAVAPPRCDNCRECGFSANVCGEYMLHYVYRFPDGWEMIPCNVMAF